MKYHIDKSSPKPAYLQLYEQLRRDIVADVYHYGSRLPSKRMISEETGVSVVTAEHAFGLLCDEGYTEARQRSGYYVIYRKSDFVTSAEAAETLVERHSSHAGGDSIFPFTVLAKTMRKILLDRGDSILVKSPNHGLPELRSAIAAYLARSQGVSAKPEQIIIGSGAEYLYSLIAQLLRGRRFSLENPSYDKIRRVYEACGIECDMLEMGHDGIKSSALTGNSSTVLHITPFNSFPTGITATASKRAEYVRWAQERQGYIIEDNYDSELTVSTKNEDTVFSLWEGGNVIYLNTFSNTVAPSLRVGYMVLPEKLVGEFGEKLGFYSCTVPVFEQYVLAELITSGAFERHINRVRRAKRKNRP